MLESIEHRGRDDAGVFVSEAFGGERLKTALGHRRLSILDTTSAGHQPFFSEDGRYVLTFNGEIYNFLEIRKLLEAKGYRFKTNSDTEVLINAFAEWNADCLPKLNGMFAFAVWDKREKTLFLARDRAGIKPLYYSETAGNFVFASEIKAILASELLKPELDMESFNQFLTFLWAVPPRTLFKNIYQLLPGHFAVWQDNKIQIHEWWDLNFDSEDNGTSEDVWKERVSETLDRAVRMEMAADVPVGAFLSGGIDSSTIVALMAKRGGKISTYTTGISTEDLSFDIIPNDVKWARKVAELIPVDYHETFLEPNLTELLPKLIYHQDAPVIDMAIPSFLVSEQSRGSQKVMLSGMGGDEIFGGYPRQLAMQFTGLTDFVPTSIRSPLMRTLDGMLYGGARGKFTAPLRNVKKFAKSAALEFEDRYLGFGTYFTDRMKQKLYSDDSLAAVGSLDPYKYHRRYFDKSRNFSALNRLLYVDFKTFMPALNLDTTDKTSMAANLEVRVPFLNHELVSLCEKLPAALKIKGLKRKYILKKVAEQYLPKEVVWRKKAGFSAPIRSWLRGALKPMVDDLLADETIKRRGLFEAGEVRRLIKLNDSGREDLNLQIFQLLAFEIWMREFID